MRASLALAILVAAVALTPIAAGADGNQIDTLRGIRAVCIDLQIDREAQKQGLSLTRIQSAIENRLREAGFQIVSGEEASRSSGIPTLRTTINTHMLSGWHDMGYCAYSIRTMLYQDVLLSRNQTVQASASTWSVDFTGMVGKRSLDKIDVNVVEVIDAFITDCISANK